jgi:hypothetical protein
MQTNSVKKAAREPLVAPQSIESILAIAFFGRSGSYFLHSLLDSHPNIINMPGDWISRYYHFWNEFGDLPPSALIEKFKEYFLVYFDPVAGDPENLAHLKELGANRDQSIGVDQSIFTRILESILGESESSVSRKLFFQSIHVAYATALGQRIDTSRPPIIVFAIHGAQGHKVTPLIEDFPETRFITMLREPTQGMNAIFRVGIETQDIRAAAMGAGVIGGGCFGGWQLGLSSARSRAIKLEDLHRDGRKVLEKLCEWANIPWHDNLLKSTFDGKQWWNVKGSPQVSGFNLNMITERSKLEYISPFDRYRLMAMIVNKYVAWGYDYPQWFHWIMTRVILLPFLLIPFRMELISYKLAMENEARLGKIIRAYIRGREVCAKGWLQSFMKADATVKLL